MLEYLEGAFSYLVGFKFTSKQSPPKEFSFAKEFMLAEKFLFIYSVIKPQMHLAIFSLNMKYRPSIQD